MGRYAQADPLGVAGGLNVYAYVGNDPVRMIDPLGLEPDQNALARRLLIANDRAGVACWDAYFKESEHSLTDCFAYTAKTDCTEFEYGSETQVNCYKKVGECAVRTTGYIKHLLCAPIIPPRTAAKIAAHLINDYAERAIGYCD